MAAPPKKAKREKKTVKPIVPPSPVSRKDSDVKEPLSPVAGLISGMEAKDDMGLAEQKLANLRKYMAQKKSPKLKTCAKLIQDLKLILIRFQLIPPFTGDSAVTEKQLHIARETLEQAVLLSVKQQDLKSFERNFAQLKPYYTDYSHLLRESERHWPLVGLNLLGLLAHNRIAEFHTELELIPPEDREKLYISYSMDLEQKMMEGAYSKVLNAPSRLPVPYYSFFTDILMKTVREKISYCTEKAYKDCPLDEAAGVFLLEKREEVIDLAQKRNWEIRDNTIIFPHKTDSEVHIPAHRLVKQSLEYANELERII